MFTSHPKLMLIIATTLMVSCGQDTNSDDTKQAAMDMTMTEGDDMRQSSTKEDMDQPAKEMCQTIGCKAVDMAQSQEDMATAELDMESVDAAMNQEDMLQNREDMATPSNPEVKLVRELTFEQPAGTNGWSDPDGLVFNWRKHPTGRDFVPDAMIRGATSINEPEVVSTQSYRGKRSARFVMKPWGSSSSSFRTDLEMIGNRNASPPVERTFRQGKTHVVGFAMRIENATVPKTGFQLYHQYHNSNPAKKGWGTTNNPAVSLVRSTKNSDDLVVLIRHNRPNEERGLETISIPGGVRAGQWVRWVFKTKFSSFGDKETGFVEVWSATGDDPLKLHGRVDGPVGYKYENPDHAYELIIFACYGAPKQDDAAINLDEVRIVDGDLPPSTVDPLSWYSYQHPLNQPYDTDLAARP